MFVPSRDTSAANGSERPVLTRLAAAVASLLALGVGVLGTLPADASVLRALTLSELRQRADVIVAGKVVGLRTETREGRLETVARVRVHDSWRGAEGRTVTVRFLGGVHKGRRVIVPGAASVQRGEHVLLFLYRSADALRPVGMFQGVWRLEDEAAGVARASSAAGASVLRPRAGSAAVDRAQRTVAQLVGQQGAGR